MDNGEDTLTKDEPYLERIESKEIKKLVNRLYQDQPDHSMNINDTASPKIKDNSLHSSDPHAHIASKIDKLFENNTALDEPAEPVKAPLPEFPATEKPKKIEKPSRPEKKRGFFGFFKT
jgi:hypothetical protein